MALIQVPMTNKSKQEIISEMTSKGYVFVGESPNAAGQPCCYFEQKQDKKQMICD